MPKAGGGMNLRQQGWSGGRQRTETWEDRQTHKSHAALLAGKCTELTSSMEWAESSSSSLLFHWGLEYENVGVSVMARHAKLPSAVPTSHTGASSYLSFSSSLLKSVVKQQRMANVLVPLYPHRRTGGSSWLPASDQPNSGHCFHLGSEPGEGSCFSLGLSFSL